jgi:hypothetical protein
MVHNPVPGINTYMLDLEVFVCFIEDHEFLIYELNIREISLSAG